MTLTTLLHSIAGHLPGKWMTREIDAERISIMRDDNLKLTFLIGRGWAKSGKIYVCFSRPRDKQNNFIEVYEGNTRLQDPSINVSASKSAEQIAADITRRLLPDAERVFALVNERIHAANTYEFKCNSLMQDLCDIVNGPNFVLSKHEIESKQINLGGVSAGGYGTAKISSDSVSFSLSSIPADKARELVAFLQSNTFAAPAATESAS